LSCAHILRQPSPASFLFAPGAGLSGQPIELASVRCEGFFSPLPQMRRYPNGDHSHASFSGPSTRAAGRRQCCLDVRDPPSLRIIPLDLFQLQFCGGALNETSLKKNPSISENLFPRSPGFFFFFFRSAGKQERQRTPLFLIPLLLVTLVFFLLGVSLAVPF